MTVQQVDSGPATSQGQFESPRVDPGNPDGSIVAQGARGVQGITGGGSALLAGPAPAAPAAPGVASGRARSPLARSHTNRSTTPTCCRGCSAPPASNPPRS